MPVMKEPALAEASKRVAPMSSSALPKREAGRLAEDVEHAGFIEHLAVLLGGKEAGDQRVDPDVLVRPLAGEVAGEVVHGGLGERSR
jgi:hypothetical protein